MKEIDGIDLEDHLDTVCLHAQDEPILVKNGFLSVVLISIKEYNRLKEKAEEEQIGN